jgi:DNA-binding transcriptional LysR family regulator
MELKQLEAFIRVVELQSFSQAAKSLYLTQPTISVHIVSLEKELGVKLLDRTTKKVITTAAGEKLYKYAKEILELREDIYREFKTDYLKEEQIQIAGSTIPSQHILPELIPAFQKLNDGVYFSINQGDSMYVMQEILKHRADIGFVGMNDNNSRLQYIPFYEDKLVIITPNNEHYKELLDRNCTLEELMKEPIILRENGSGTKKAAQDFLEEKKADIRKLNIVARMNDQEMIKRSVYQGMGISIISKKAALDYVKADKLLLYEPEGEPIIRNLYIVFEKNMRCTSIERKFIDFCCQFYQNKK